MDGERASERGRASSLSLHFPSLLQSPIRRATFEIVDFSSRSHCSLAPSKTGRCPSAWVGLGRFAGWMVDWRGGGDPVRHRHHHHHHQHRLLRRRRRRLRRRLRRRPPQYPRKRSDSERDPHSLRRCRSPRRTATATRDSFLIELHRGMSTFRVGRHRRRRRLRAVRRSRHNGWSKSKIH